MENMDQKLKQVVIALFIAAISLPLAQMQLKFWDSGILEEKRPKVSVPGLSLHNVASGAYMESFEQFFADNFGFRNLFIKANAKIDMTVFRMSSNLKVILGKDDYLFYYETLDDYNKQPTLTDEAIADVALRIAALQDKLAKKGVTFLFVVGPNKNTIYPEYMPSPRKNANGRSNYDKLLSELDKQHVNHLNMIPILNAHKEQSQLYDKRDTHWNSTGAVLATAAILKNLSAEYGLSIGPPQITAYRDRLPEEESGGDLNIMLGLDRNYKTARQMPVIEYGACPLPLPATLWYGDSFSELPVKYYGKYAADVTFLHYGKQKIAISLDEQLAGKSIVVFEIVERYIPQLLLALDKPESN